MPLKFYLPQCALILITLACSTYAAPTDFEAMGPYPVGVTTTVMMDIHRVDPTIKGPRTLPTEIWYPSNDLALKMPLNKHSDFFFKGNPALSMAVKMAYEVDIKEFDKIFINTAYRDAPVAEGEFPLIIFSHGNGGFRMQSLFWCEHLASHGYIVVAPDHTGNAAATVIDDKLVLNNNDRARSAIDRPMDVSFLITQMGKWNAGADSRFARKINMGQIGVGGHSFGGFTCTWVADNDERIDAIVPMAGVAPIISRPNDCPVLIIMATEDETLGIAGNAAIRNYYETSIGPRYFIEFVDAGHFSFTEMFQYRPNFGDGVGTGIRMTNGKPFTFTPKESIYRYTNGYSLAFLNKYVKGDTDPAIDAYLSTNHDPSLFIHGLDVPTGEVE